MSTVPHPFTMIEMVVVIVIVAILGTMVLMRSPSRDDAESELVRWREYFLTLAADCRRNAMMAHRQLDVRYDGSRRMWLPPEAETPPPEPARAMTIRIGEEKSPTEEITVFSFLPDGRVTGLPVVMELSDHRLEMRPSPLTGALLIRWNTPEESEDEVPVPLFEKN